MRAAFFLAALALPLAAAQAPSEADYDTAPPADDASYLADDGASVDPASGESISDADFDTSAPASDASYLADDGAPPAVPDAPSDASTDAAPPVDAPAPGSSPTPGFEVATLAGAAALVGLLRRRVT